MKIILSEATLSNHFFERLDSRLPKSVSRQYTLSKQLDGNIRLIQNLHFPKEKFIMNGLKIGQFYVCIVVVYNQVATMFLSKKLTFEQSFPVYDVVKFSEEINFIRSEKMPMGNWLYEYVDEGDSFYFVVKNKNIIKTIGKEEIVNFKNFQLYSID